VDAKFLKPLSTHMPRGAGKSRLSGGKIESMSDLLREVYIASTLGRPYVVLAGSESSDEAWGLQKAGLVEMRKRPGLASYFVDLTAEGKAEAKRRIASGQWGKGT
jgi:hypothetical protein